MSHSDKELLHVIHLENKQRDREQVADILSAEGFDCKFTFAETEREFHAALTQPNIDLILSDYSLPSYTGTEAIEAARKTKPEIPFIFVSGTIGEKRAVEVLGLGVTDYVLKDNLDRLVPVVRRALRDAELQRSQRQVQEQLRTTQQRLDHLLAESPAVIYSIRFKDQKPALAWISSYIEHFLGFNSKEACEPDWWLNQTDPQDRPALIGHPMQLLAQNQINRDLRIRHRNGEYRWVHDKQRVVCDAQGEPIEIVGSWVDFTEQRELEVLLRQSQKMEAIGQLAGGIAHDFNNLLAVIRGNADLLLMEPQQHSGETENGLKQIVAAADRAASLTRQLLVFGRKQAMQAAPFNVNDMTVNLTKMLQRIIGEDIQLQSECTPKTIFVHGDVGMIEQVLVNLVVNARDAMPHGGKLGLTTECVSIVASEVPRHPDARGGEFVRISVNDTGMGIPPGDLPHIFEPFFTTKAPGKGTGLGLAIVYGIVKQHEGWIELSSQVGAGTSFKVFLPTIPVPVPTAGAPQVSPNIRGGTERILLVEDDFALRMLTQRLLESHGYHVWKAESAQEALDIWRNHASEVNLLLTDVIMPGDLTGRELAERLHQEKPQLKIIFLSGYSVDVAGGKTDFVDRLKGRFLQKPCASRTILQTVRSCLDATDETSSGKKSSP
jgi:two-component system cell cycle sensor histidine kinase/response regulator CckA